MNVVVIEPAKASSASVCVSDNVASCPPKLENAVERLSGEIATRKNVVDRKELAFMELDCRDLDIAADRTIHGGTDKGEND